MSFSFSSSSSCPSSGKYSKPIEIPLRKWEECNTIGLKIGFIAGSTINFLAVNTDFVIRKAIQISHLNQAACLFFETFEWAVKKFLQGSEKVVNAALINAALKGIKTTIEAILNTKIAQSTINWSINKILNPVDRGVRKIANALFRAVKYLYNGCVSGAKKLSSLFRTAKASSVKINQSSNTLFNRTIVPFYNRILCPIGRFALDQLKKCKASCINALKTLVNWTLIPLKNHVLSPVAIKLKNLGIKALNSCLKAIGKSVNPMINWTIKPLFNHLLIPLLKTIAEIIEGLIGGLFGDKSDKSKKVEPKTPIQPQTPVETENEKEIDNDTELAKDLEIVKFSNDISETVTPS